jgi:hypothetical protein
VAAAVTANDAPDDASRNAAGTWDGDADGGRQKPLTTVELVASKQASRALLAAAKDSSRGGLINGEEERGVTKFFTSSQKALARQKPPR